MLNKVATIDKIHYRTSTCTGRIALGKGAVGLAKEVLEKIPDLTLFGSRSTSLWFRLKTTQEGLTDKKVLLDLDRVLANIPHKIEELAGVFLYEIEMSTPILDFKAMDYVFNRSTATDDLTGGGSPKDSIYLVRVRANKAPEALYKIKKALYAVNEFRSGCLS